MNSFKDKIFIYKIKSLRDPEIFGKFYDEYVDRIYRFIYFKVPTPQEAEDLTSEVFLKFWQAVQNQDNVKNIKSYIYSIARNIVVDFYRSKSNRYEVSLTASLDDMQFQSLKSDLDILQKIDGKTEISKLFSAVNNLKDEYKEVILLRYIEEIPIKEISQIIDKSKGATRVLIHRALKALREVLLKDKKDNSSEV